MPKGRVGFTVGFGWVSFFGLGPDLPNAKKARGFHCGVRVGFAFLVGARFAKGPKVAWVSQWVSLFGLGPDLPTKGALRGYRRGKHKATLLEEMASPKFVVSNKKVLQAHVDGAILGQSATQLYTYEVFLWRMPHIRRNSPLSTSGRQLAAGHVASACP